MSRLCMLMVAAFVAGLPSFALAEINVFKVSFFGPDTGDRDEGAHQQE